MVLVSGNRIGIPGSLIVLLIVSVWVGCGPRSDTPATPDSNQTSSIAPAAETPAAATAVAVTRYAQPDETVRQFLSALKQGDQQRATSMLTRKAQQEMEKSQAAIQPPGSSTAQFQVTRVQLLGEKQQAAHVLSNWTDTEADGSESTHQLVWILRHESQGWAVAGFATRVFEDQPPLILNFEDPGDLQRKRTAVDAEIARRNADPVVQQAQHTEPAGVRRR